MGSMTQEELRQMISDTVQRTLEDLLPKQLARQRSMLESELKWHLGDLIKEAIAAGGPGAADTAAQEQASQETPKINTSIDWSFLE